MGLAGPHHCSDGAVYKRFSEQSVRFEEDRLKVLPENAVMFL